MSDKYTQAAKKLRRALQVALSVVELDPDDVSELDILWDAFDPEQKYKKGMVAMDGGTAYICIKTVKSGTLPSQDPGHWQQVLSGGDQPTVPEYDPDATYHKGDRVSWNGSTWVCQKNNVQGIEPGTNGKCWVVPDADTE